MKQQITCTFIGLGLIGGSVAKALKLHNDQIFIQVYDTDSNAMELALQEKTADKIYSSINEELCLCDYLFLCAPVSINLKNLESISAPPVPTGREPRGVWPGSGHGPRTHGGGEGTAGVGERGAPAGRTGRRDPTPATTTGPHPRHRVARDRPRPPTHPGGSNTQRPLAARGRAPRGEDRPQKARRARGGGLGASSRSPSPFSRAASPPRPQSLRGDAVSALRGTEGPAGPARTAPSRAPRRGD